MDVVEADRVPAPRRWPTIGGHPALDLANTVSWRLDPSRRADRLTSFADLTEWSRVVTELDVERLGSGRLGPEAAEPAGDALVAVRRLRDASTAMLESHLTGRRFPADDREVVEVSWRQALGHSHLGGELPLRWDLSIDTPGDLVDALALLVGGFLSSAELPGLRRCAGEGCGWLFLDRTRNHSRRWCDPTDCGNRTRVRRYTERHSGAAV